MEQNNIWMRYLVLGGIFSLLILYGSCRKEYVRNGIFYFVNQTNHNITYENLFQEYNVAPNATIEIVQPQYANEKFDVNKYFSPLLAKRKDTVSIRFNNNRCLTNQTINSIHSVLDIKNFVREKIGNISYKFTYTFTEADYNRATTCP